MAKLLVIADAEGKGYATPRGLELADRLGLEVEVYAFVYAPLKRLKVGADEEKRLRDSLVSQREELVQARIEKHRRPGQKIHFRTIWEKDVARWVAARCKGGDYQMVVKTGHRTDGLLHMSTDWQLLRDCPVPVVIVSSKKWSRTKPVLAALDLATTVASKRKLNELILTHAQALAAALDTRLAIVSAIEVPVLLQELDLVDPHTYARDQEREQAPHRAALAKRLGLDEDDFKVKRGPVPKVIASEAARTRAQLVVMGTVGRKGVKARLMGNTAEQVLQHLRTDVMAVKL